LKENSGEHQQRRKFSCYATSEYKRYKTSSQVHTHVSHCLQPEKIIEMGAKKNKNSGGENEKGCKKPLF